MKTQNKIENLKTDKSLKMLDRKNQLAITGGLADSRREHIPNNPPGGN